jgi:signal recognition particle subunit SRP72
MLFDFQRALERRNKHINDLKSQKHPGVEARTFQFINTNAHPTTSAELANTSAIRATAQGEGGAGRPLLQSALGLLEKRPDDVGLLVTAIQLLMEVNNAGAATSLLDTFFRKQEGAASTESADVRFSPGLIGLAVALYKAQGRIGSAKAELAGAARYWSRREGRDGCGSSLLREAGVTLLKSLDPNDIDIARTAFEAHRTQESIDPVANAGLVAAFALRDPNKIKQQLDQLPDVDVLISGIDAKGLVERGLASTSAAGLDKRKRAAGYASDDRPTKKKRTRKLPKDYEEGRAPDPERWLPLRDRSSYRPKGKKGKKKANEATQGGPVKEETLELVGGAGAVKVEKAPTPGASSKKKKKGKK